MFLRLRRKILRSRRRAPDPVRKTAYQYQSLDKSSRQIRPVTLLPSSDSNAPVRIELFTETFPTINQEYEALSYAWGDSSASYTIFEERGAIDIGRNLYLALRHLRQRDQPQTLWIDALCINQRDDQEKNHQVRQMRDIFSKASKVLVWLGTSDHDTKAAMAFLQLPRETRDDTQMPMPGLRKLYGNAWWSRMWVVQEVFVAHEDPVVCCGHECAPWEAVTTTLVQICFDELDQRKGSWIIDEPLSLLYFSLLRPEIPYERKRSLEDLLKATANRRAAQPHDYIYALYGIVFDETEKHLQPEINYSLPASAAFQDAMVIIFNSRQDLDWLLLAARGAAEPSTQGVLPSWCVDFSTKDRRRNIENKDWDINAKEYRAENREELGATAGREMDPVLHDRASGIIKISGTRIGSVVFSNVAHTEAIRRFRGSGQLPDDLESLLLTEIQHLAYDIVIFIINSQEAWKSRLGQEGYIKKFANGDIWRTASSGKSFHSLVKSDKQSDKICMSPRVNGYALLDKFCDDMHPLWSVMTHEWRQCLPEVPEGFERAAIHAYLEIAFHTAGKCYFTTDTGYIGLAGHEVKEGDVVCILFGCKLPAVLRPQGDGTFALLTFTYTDDVMHGEFLADASAVVEETFTLR